ncbi:NAD(P)-binding protein [Thiohalobacter sp.]|uniref:NAD(P)-binding protein n=1 Tax=Thiohalobacter sp. TaxID=2025948 RepID=UPI00260CCD81|nr:NAD(P)-binding protein [Thiohalobacter sp.]
MAEAGGQVVEIVGAGPAGLAAALAVRAAGREAVVHERRADVGLRFHGDFQGLENWTTPGDVLDELAAAGIVPEFGQVPFHEVTLFDPDGVPRLFRSEAPLFHLLRRGPGPGTLDAALKAQALAAGAELRFGDTVSRLPQGGIVTEGPHRADAIAAGWLFETDMADAAYAAISDRLAPKGYAYLLIQGGQGTLASCLFDDFHREREYVARVEAFFRARVGLVMRNPRRFGGSGNFFLPRTARKGNILYAGEAAGFQDPLFGFGLRSALLSGAAAGRALAAGRPADYETFWRERLRPRQETAATNRWLYERLGDRGYRAVIHRFPADGDPRDYLRRAYAPRLLKRLWYRAWVGRRQQPLLQPHPGCDCTWCRCRHLAEGRS